MNLKTAAHRLGVHYQTAYRWVRSGELVAVRSGSGYEISEASVAVMADRIAAREQLAKYIVPPVEAEPLSFRRELEVLVAECTLSAQPVFDALVRKMAAMIDGTVVLYLDDPSGGGLRPAASFDIDPSRRVLVDAMHASGELRVSTHGVQALMGGHGLEVHHLRLDQALAMVPAKFREHSERLLVQSLVAAPVVMTNGRARGLLAVVRFAGAPAFPRETLAWATAGAAYVAKAIEHVARFSAAWAARETLFDRLVHLVAERPDLDLTSDVDAVDAILDHSLPEAVFDPLGNLVVASEAFFESVAPHAVTHAEAVAVVTAALQEDHHAEWQQLLSGSTDYLSTALQIDAIHPDGHVQWALVRRPDLTPVAVVAVCERSDPAGSSAT